MRPFSVLVVLLSVAGCAIEPSRTAIEPSAIVPATSNERVKTPAKEDAGKKTSSVSSCKRGAQNSQLSFVLCTSADATESQITKALKRPADLTLNLRSITAQLGLSKAELSGIEPATYAQIVGKAETPSPRELRRSEDKADDGPGEIVEIGGRNFRKFVVKHNQESALLLIEA